MTAPNQCLEGVCRCTPGSGTRAESWSLESRGQRGEGGDTQAGYHRARAREVRAAQREISRGSSLGLGRGLLSSHEEMSPKLEKETPKGLEEAVPLFCLWGDGAREWVGILRGKQDRPSAWSLSRTWERKWVVLCLSLKVDV